MQQILNMALDSDHKKLGQRVEKENPSLHNMRAAVLTDQDRTERYKKGDTTAYNDDINLGRTGKKGKK